MNIPEDPRLPSDAAGIQKQLTRLWRTLAPIINGKVDTSVSTTAPVLTNNYDMSFQLVSNTQLKVFVRGSDGVTRSVTLTLT